MPTPAGAAKASMIGSSEWVASAGASSVSVYTIVGDWLMASPGYVGANRKTQGDVYQMRAVGWSPRTAGRLRYHRSVEQPNAIPGSPATGGGQVPEIRARLCVTSDTLSPDQITERLGITPHRSNRMGDPLHRRSTEARWKVHYWAAGMVEADPWDLDSYVSAVLESLEGHETAARALAQSPDADVKILIGVDLFEHNNITSTPGFGLEAGTLARMADLGLALDCDVNVLSRE